MGSPDFFLYAKHMSVSLEIPLKDFRGQYSRQVVYGILSVVSTLLPPLNRLLQLLRAGC